MHETMLAAVEAASLELPAWRDRDRWRPSRPLVAACWAMTVEGIVIALQAFLVAEEIAAASSAFKSWRLTSCGAKALFFSLVFL